MKRKYVATGLVAGLIAGSSAGFLLEQSGLASAASEVAARSVAVTDDTTSSDDTAADAATGGRTGRGDRADRLGAALQPLIEDGTITQAQADAVVAALADAGPWRGGRHGRGVWWFAARIESITTALGTTVDELHDALAAGGTLREVATAAGVDPQVVVDALVADAKEHLDAEVAEGELTQAQADAALARVTTRATEILDEAGLPREWDRGGRGRGHHGSPDDETPATSVPETDGTDGTATTDTVATGS